MHIELKQKPQPVAVTKSEYDLFAGNIKIGSVIKDTEAKSYEYHVVLESKHHINVYQGFGFTVDEALRCAVEVGKERRRLELLELNDLENVIWGDHELN